MALELGHHIHLRYNNVWPEGIFATPLSLLCSRYVTLHHVQLNANKSRGQRQTGTYGGCWWQSPRRKHETGMKNTQRPADDAYIQRLTADRVLLRTGQGSGQRRGQGCLWVGLRLRGGGEMSPGRRSAAWSSLKPERGGDGPVGGFKGKDGWSVFMPARNWNLRKVCALVESDGFSSHLTMGHGAHGTMRLGLWNLSGSNSLLALSKR